MFGFPFGFPGGQGQGQQYDGEDGEYGEQEQINNTQYYQILGIDQSATQQQIKQAYQKMIAQLHPDTTPQDAQKLKLINEAYQTLKDQQKRAIYDEYGKDQSHEQTAEHGQNIYDMFFGGGNKKKGQQQKPKVQSTQQLFEITLQNVYNGDTVQFAHKRMRCCQKCGGKGGENVKQCQQCKGQGRIVQMFQVGPGAYQQMQKLCEKCSGQGQFMKQQDKCTQCLGKKILQKQKNLQVVLQKGTPNNFPITINGQGNQIPNALPGDLILVTKQKEHQIFKRQGADLYMKKDITLLQALTGFQFTIKHLNGNQYTLYTEQGQVLQDQTKKIVKELGMPFHKKPDTFGNLIVQFHVIMPKRDELTKQQLKQIIQLLPGEVNERPKIQDYHMFEDFDIQNVNTNQQGGKLPQDQYNEDQAQGGQYCTTQ